MKKLSCMLVIVICFMLSSCAEYVPDSFIIYNHQLHVCINLGESKSAIERILGHGKPGKIDFYEYDHGNISVLYTSKPGSKAENAHCIVITGKGWSTDAGFEVGVPKDTIEMLYNNVSDITEPILFDKDGVLTKKPDQATYTQKFTFDSQTLSSITFGYADNQ